MLCNITAYHTHNHDTYLHFSETQVSIASSQGSHNLGRLHTSAHVVENQVLILFVDVASSEPDEQPQTEMDGSAEDYHQRRHLMHIIVLTINH